MTFPFENNTSAIVKKLAQKNLHRSKRRNIMVIVSVALAAFLISFAGSFAVSLVQMQSNQVVDTYEAVYSKMAEQDIALLKSQSEISRVGKYYLIGEEQSKRGFKGSFIYADETMMYIGRQQMELQEGSLPKQDNEILVSDNWLEKYEPDARIGDMVSLDTESFSGKFIIAGITNGASIEGSDTYGFVISKQALEEYIKYNRNGYRAYIHLNDAAQMNEEQIRTYCEANAKKYNFAAPSYNSQYFAWSSHDRILESVGVIGLLAVIVLMGGCVVIQSIFRISVLEKIQSFGQLRTLGATKKQVARIMQMEGLRLGLCGIVIGTFVGILLPILLIPDSFHIGGIAAVAIITVLICWIMISISIRIPIKIAANVSPIEAAHFSTRQTIFTNRSMAAKKLNAFTLGSRNFIRDKKKAASILVSLSIGGVLLLVVSTLLLTYSPEILSRTDFPNGDYKIYMDSNEGIADVLYSGTPLTEELKQDILAINGVKEIVVTRQSAGADFQIADISEGGICDRITSDNYAAIEAALSEGTMPADAHSIIVSDAYENVQVGTTAKISLGKSETVVTISGVFDATKCFAGVGHGNLGLDAAMLFAPYDLFAELLPGIEEYDYGWDIVSDPRKDTSVKSGLEELVNAHTEIKLDTFDSHVAYNTFAYSFVFHVLQGVTLFISLFGAVNFINTILSNQVSQQREVSTLRSVGMTQKQVYHMTVYECLSYAFFSILLIIIAGVPLAYIVHREISKIAYGYPTAFHFPFFYMGLYVLFLLLLGFILSIWGIKQQRKYSLIEQLRA